MGKSRLTIFYKDIKMNRYIDTGVDMNAQEFKALEFAVFCIENVAKKLEVDGTAAYDMLAVQTDILQNYIIPCYDVLHTQGKEYIVNDLIDMLKAKGVIICSGDESRLDAFSRKCGFWKGLLYNTYL